MTSGSNLETGPPGGHVVVSRVEKGNVLRPKELVHAPEDEGVHVQVHDPIELCEAPRVQFEKLEVPAAAISLYGPCVLLILNFVKTKRKISLHDSPAECLWIAEIVVGCYRSVALSVESLCGR